MRTYKYFSEDIDKLTDITDDVLNKPNNIYGEYIINSLHCQNVYDSITSVSISYNADRVQTSHTSYDDKLVLLADLNNKCNELLTAYNVERQKLYNMLQAIDFTNDEYFVLHHRYLVKQPLSFEKIAVKHGNMDRKKAFYLYTKAYIKAANYIEAMYKGENAIV